MQAIRIGAVVAALLVPLAGCQSEDVSCPDYRDTAVPFDEQEGCVIPDIPEPDVEEDVPTQDVEDDTGPGEMLVGQPCEEDGDCGLDFCLNDTFIQTVAPDADIPIPNGLCSSNPFSPPADCGPEAGLFNLQPAFGTDAEICLALCEGLADCRWDEAVDEDGTTSGGYSCYQPDPEDERTFCIPDSLVIVIEEERAAAAGEGN
ncbi:MAG: hypothetical protein ACQEXJ_23115 [Myxococcota bacterium]